MLIYEILNIMEKNYVYYHFLLYFLLSDSFDFILFFLKVEMYVTDLKYFLFYYLSILCYKFLF